jgi:GNAT superfamily N-acetyltransferase
MHPNPTRLRRPVETRRAVRGDLAALTGLWLALTRHHAELDRQYALRPGADARARELLADQLARPDTAIFVVDAEAGLAGYAIVRVDEAPPIHPETRRAEISDLYVDAARRRAGVARALVAAATGWARERGAQRLQVRALVRNRSAQAFWRAEGYGEHMDVLQRRL